MSLDKTRPLFVIAIKKQTAIVACTGKRVSKEMEIKTKKEISLVHSSALSETSAGTDATKSPNQSVRAILIISMAIGIVKPVTVGFYPALTRSAIAAG